MAYQNISGTIPPLVVTDVTTKLNDIITALAPYVVNLSMEERAQLYKMGAQRYSLVQKTITVADTQAQLVPAFVSVPDLKDDFNCYDQMAPLLQLAAQISERLNDAMMARGNEALTKGTKPIYASVKAAVDQNVPGANAAYDLLNPYFDLPDQPDGGNP